MTVAIKTNEFGMTSLTDEYPYLVVDTNTTHTYSCQSIGDIHAAIKLIHVRDSEVVMGEMLESIEIHGTTITETVEIYAEILRVYEGDTVCRIFFEQGSTELFEQIEAEEQNDHLIIL